MILREYGDAKIVRPSALNEIGKMIEELKRNTLT